MCSIIGYYGETLAAPILVKGLKRMEYRGYDSVGVATKSLDKILVKKGIGKVSEVNQKERLDTLPGNIGIGHTRWATHGKVTDVNAHPHSSNSEEIAIVHNGIIENYQDLKNMLVKEGYSFKSETDTEVYDENLSQSFNGVLLVATVIVVTFLGLYYVAEKLVKRTGSSRIAKPVAVALMIAIGIGLHNFGEGLAIGAAVGIGSIAFSTFLIVGFALHNTTEGIAIAAPMSRGKTMIEKALIGKLAALGMIAGSPAIFGAWIGGFVYSPFATVVFLSIGAGAIFQVVITVLRWVREEGDKNLSSAAVASGIAVGMLIMYLTSILI